MRDLLMELLTAVLTVCVPILAAYGAKLIKRAAENAEAKTDDLKLRSHLAEIAEAVTKAVSYTSQTYVDSLKAAGKFSKEAQQEALQKSLTAAIGILTPAAASFIEETYGDIKTYILPMVEAEVRKQKLELPEVLTPATGVTAEPDAAAIAASTAAATAATIAQTAVSQLVAEPTVAEPEE